MGPQQFWAGTWLGKPFGQEMVPDRTLLAETLCSEPFRHQQVFGNIPIFEDGMFGVGNGVLVVCSCVHRCYWCARVFRVL